jgi:hypothetical protein
MALISVAAGLKQPATTLRAIQMGMPFHILMGGRIPKIPISTVAGLLPPDYHHAKCAMGRISVVDMRNFRAAIPPVT